MSDDLQGCKPCDCDVGGAVNDRCDQRTGQCTCRPNIIGRRCDEVSPGYFVVSLDWERYEAEKARGIGVSTQSTVKTVVAITIKPTCKLQLARDPVTTAIKLTSRVWPKFGFGFGYGQSAVAQIRFRPYAETPKL